MIDGCRLAIAPMMGWSDRHFREFMRCMLGEVEVYTEMVTTGAVIHNPEIIVDHAPEKSILQIGGSCPEECRRATEIAKDVGYSAINLNVGCPSNRVQNAKIGVILMKEPDLVRDCMLAMRSVSGMHCSVKTRLGVDEFDDWDFINEFIRIVSESGCTDFVIHARKAWLQGLSPKQNRDVPPLNYERYFALERAWAQYTFSLNGGIKTFDDARALYQKTNKLMFGRLATDNVPQLLQISDYVQSCRLDLMSRWEAYVGYMTRENQNGIRARFLLTPVMALLVGMRGARALRSQLSEVAMRQDQLRREVIDDLTGFISDSFTD